MPVGSTISRNQFQQVFTSVALLFWQVLQILISLAGNDRSLPSGYHLTTTNAGGISCRRLCVERGSATTVLAFLRGGFPGTPGGFEGADRHHGEEQTDHGHDADQHRPGTTCLSLD